MRTIYLDESGDLGFSSKSSKYFVIFLYSTMLEEKQIKKIVKNSKDRISKNKKGKKQELKGFSSPFKLRESVIKNILEKDKEISLFSVVINKKNVYDSLRERKRVLYNWICKEILKNNNEKVNLIIDRKDTKSIFINEINNYLEKNLKVVSIKHLDSQKTYGLQVCDIFANSVFKKFEREDIKLFQLFENKTNLSCYFFDKK